MCTFWVSPESDRQGFRANGGAVPDVVHADRGTSMTSKPVAQLLVDLNIVRSHSRPRVSNDNPYSEANFKTLKYCPVFPGRFRQPPIPPRLPKTAWINEPAKETPQEEHAA